MRPSACARGGPPVRPSACARGEDSERGWYRAATGHHAGGTVQWDTTRPVPCSGTSRGGYRSGVHHETCTVRPDIAKSALDEDARRRRLKPVRALLKLLRPKTGDCTMIYVL